MKVLRLLIAAGLLALLPAVTLAAGKPSPDVLKAALADPPAGDWTETAPTSGGLEGLFDANTYASNTTNDAAQQAAAVQSLEGNGFVTGYGRIWSGSAGTLVENILAFQDSRGAGTQIQSFRRADESDSIFQGTVDSSSIPNSYAVEDKIGSSLYSVVVVWVKGNDILVVVFVAGRYSVTDTLEQAKKVNSAAPAYTIAPPAPRSAVPGIPIRPISMAIGGVLLLLLAVAGAGYALTRRRPSGLPSQATAPPTGPDR